MSKMAPMHCWSLVPLAILLSATAAPVTEYVGFAPCGTADNPSKGATTLKWMELTYEPSVSSAKDVTFKWLTQTVSEVGALWELDLSQGGGNGAALSAKLLDNTMVRTLSSLRRIHPRAHTLSHPPPPNHPRSTCTWTRTKRWEMAPDVVPTRCACTTAFRATSQS